MPPQYSTIPAAHLARLLAEHPVAPHELAILKHPRTPDRYYGVYERRTPEGSTFRARVLKFIELGHFTNREDAGRAIVAWYKHTYGLRWERVYRQRRVNPWRTQKIIKKCVWSTSPGYLDVFAWRSEVYYRGVPRVITPKDAGDEKTKGYTFPTKEKAREAAKKVVAREMEERQLVSQALYLWRA